MFGLGVIAISVHHRLVEPWSEIMRDSGIAFVIAAVVTLTYEAYARQRSAAETVEDLLGKVIGDIVDPKTWDEVRAQILDKAAIRKCMAVRIRVERREDLPGGQLVLWVGTTYRLASLRSHEQAVPVLHFLDGFMKTSALNVPRFVRVVVDGELVKVPDDALRVELKVPLPARGSGSVPITIEREEVVYFPGAYNLIMSELTELESVELWSAPQDVQVEVNCIFDEKVIDVGKAMKPNRVLLPGQCIEVRLTPKPLEPQPYSPG